MKSLFLFFSKKISVIKLLIKRFFERGKNKNRSAVIAFAALFISIFALLFTLVRSSGGISHLRIFFEDQQIAPSPLYAVNRNAKKAFIPRRGQAVSVDISADRSSGRFFSPSPFYARSSYAYFAFTDEQRSFMELQYERNGGAAFALEAEVKRLSPKNLSLLKTSKLQKTFSMGFLYEEDFSSFGKLKKEIGGRPLVSADLSSVASEKDVRFTLALCFSREKDGKNFRIPSGFFVYSALPAAFVKASLIRPIVGWDQSKMFFAFAPNGGTAGSALRSFDFSGAESVFPVQNTADSLMPLIKVGFVPAEGASAEGTFAVELEKNAAMSGGAGVSDTASSAESVGKTAAPGSSASAEPAEIFAAPNAKIVPVTVSFGGEKLTFYYTGIQGQGFTQCVPAAALQSPFDTVSLGDNSSLILSVLMEAAPSELLKKKDGNVLLPYVCDPGLVISWKPRTWRGQDYELFEWPQFPGVLFFDVKSYSIQRDFFRRLAFYAEKSGYRGRLLTDAELGNLHGYNAYDYGAASLAEFFSDAYKQGFALNQKEYLLRDILLENGVIVSKADGSYGAGRGAVISISQESQEWLRRTFTAHEGWHGIFFTDADFRNAVAAVYYTMDQNALAFLHRFWSTQPGLQYDLNDTYLMHNETMAYLMQQPLSQLQPYYMARASWVSVQKNQKASADYIIKTKAAGLEDAAAVLDSYAFDRWRFNAGRVWLTVR
ncbi:hypothetical protein HRI96_03855 [Treponema parvum]|uniref:Peptidase M60 domain-containing protein n=1 Tax=Treponema parvum TaxID=138851 RepID=A0A975EZ52_9SPIR|nr:hypothetical protein [Treponema parvum]QTQ11407.1 hypothetical protein HRI96_03855 [Treponema parvum]